MTASVVTGEIRRAPFLTFIHSPNFSEICSTPHASAGGILSLKQVVGLDWNAGLVCTGMRGCILLKYAPDSTCCAISADTRLRVGLTRAFGGRQSRASLAQRPSPA